MSEQLLQVRNLSVSVEDKPILHGIDLEVRPGETHVLMGPNGAGKSTLGYTIMGSPRYEVTGGEILFKGKQLLEETADQRAKDGIFLSFQNPLDVPGLPRGTFIRSAVDGVFLPLIEHNHYVKKGDLIGEVVDPFEGTVKQQIRTERGGLLFTLRAYPVVYEGDLLARILTE